MSSADLCLKDDPREPDEIRKSMRLWRLGFTAMPQAYINYHEKLARKLLEKLRLRFGFTIHKISMENEGWMDGMKALNAIIETRLNHKLMKLQWHDGNRGFMVEMPSGGAGSLSESDFDEKL
jgi:hypothetical protein